MSDSTRPSVVLTHHRPGGEVEVVLAGRLDISCVGRLRNAVLLASDDATGELSVETSRVTAVDGVGLRTLIACRRLAAALGVQLVLERPSESLIGRLARTGLLRTFTVRGAASGLGSSGPVHASRTVSAR